MFQDVQQRIKKKNQILFQHDSACLQSLLTEMAEASHRTLVLWALDCVNTPLAKLENLCPEEIRPRLAVEQCTKWARGELKMPEAKRAILAAHSAAKEMKPVPAALCHGIAQGVSTVHVKSHAPGLPFYELTAIVREKGNVGYEEAVLRQILVYQERLVYWKVETPHIEQPWAGFIRQ